MLNFWDTIYFGNTVAAWLSAAGIILAGLAAVYLVKHYLVVRLKHWSEQTNTSFDDFLVSFVIKSLIPVLFFICVYGGIFWLNLSPGATRIFNVLLLLVITFFSLKSINAALKYFLFSFLKKQEHGEVKQKQASGLLVIAQAVVWILGMVFLLDNFGYNITTIIAGLGIGGIAIALAAQTILGDVFSYFVILFDRPFEIGDFIIVDDKMGVIEYIGIKTTRIRAITGEQLICSNKNLTDSRIHNYKRMEQRRVVLKPGLTYQTPAALLETVPAMVREIISTKELVLFDRAHFSGFGDFSLNFEIVYFILSSDYNLFMDRQQEINLEIYRSFERAGLSFAFPTQTVFIGNADRTAEAMTNGKEYMNAQV